ncbi:BrnT family toxin [Massilia sp. SM-13]|uniref:BrnT family toxin n=1 Tax=Pseudoduganella rhizocola TaxID=3382643 RepID=UPI0038B46C71
MLITWDESKRRTNLKKHGWDFSLVQEVLDGITYMEEDRRYNYPERRYWTFGLSGGHVVLIVHTETQGRFHVISFRKADRQESRRFWDRVGKPDRLGQGGRDG